MSENKFVTETCNAANVEQTNILETKLVIKRMESKFDFYSKFFIKAGLFHNTLYV